MSQPSTVADAFLPDAHRLLLEHADPDTSAELVAQGARVVFETLCRRLATFVGDSGVAAVLDRSSKEASAALGWNGSPPAAARRWPEQIEGLVDRLRGRDAADAREGAVRILATFLGMVSTFIGAALTSRLLHDLWPEIFEGKEVPT